MLKHFSLLIRFQNQLHYSWLCMQFRTHNYYILQDDQISYRKNQSNQKCCMAWTMRVFFCYLQFELVCDRKWIIAMAKTTFMLGFFFGALLSGMAADRFVNVWFEWVHGWIKLFVRSPSSLILSQLRQRYTRAIAFGKVIFLVLGDFHKCREYGKWITDCIDNYSKIIPHSKICVRLIQLVLAILLRFGDGSST